MEPGFIKVAIGDTINFVPSDVSHNAQSFSIPAGAEEFVTPMGAAMKVTFTQEGVYLYQCLPHTMMGMVGVIQVGEAVNLEQVKQDFATLEPSVSMNKERIAQYMEQVK